jgi:hypothetical protein
VEAGIFFEKRKELNAIFKIRDKHEEGREEKDVRNGLYVINKIYTRWTGVEFKNDDKGEKSQFQTCL